MHPSRSKYALPTGKTYLQTWLFPPSLPGVFRSRYSTWYMWRIHRKWALHCGKPRVTSSIKSECFQAPFDRDRMCQHPVGVKSSVHFTPPWGLADAVPKHDMWMSIGTIHGAKGSGLQHHSRPNSPGRWSPFHKKGLSSVGLMESLGCSTSSMEASNTCKGCTNTLTLVHSVATP